MENNSQENLIEPSLMRRVLGHFPTGVVVVTANPADGPIGMTLQSFMSLSLEPPLVLLSIGRGSKTWPAMRDVGRFVINVLAEDQSTLARQFAASGTDKFAGVSWSPLPATGSPVLDGAVAWIDCEQAGEFDGGDHVIVVARVLAVSPETETATGPLVFHRSAFPTLEHQD